MTFDALLANYLLWKIIGFTGILIFGSRFVIQWLYSEKHKESKIPPIFWWQSVVGTILCLAYALRQRDSVFIAGYSLNLIPYVRNLMLIRAKRRLVLAAGGGTKNSAAAPRRGAESETAGVHHSS